VDVGALDRIADRGDRRRLGLDELQERRELRLRAGREPVARAQAAEPRGGLRGHRQS
jgi:hypothetical protein